MSRKTKKKSVPFVPDPSNKRLRLVRERAGLKSARQAAIANGWPPSTYASHENGQIKPVPSDKAVEYGEAFRVNGVWIHSGEPKLKPRWYRTGMEDEPEVEQAAPVRVRVRAPRKVLALSPPPKEIQLLESVPLISAPGPQGSTAVIERSHEANQIGRMKNRDDGHRVIDLSTATGELKQFLDDNMGPHRELWQVDSDAINLHIPEGSYVVIDTDAPIEPRDLVLAELATPDGPVFRLGSSVGPCLLFPSKAVKNPPFLMRDDNLKIVGPIVAVWPQPKETF